MAKIKPTADEWKDIERRLGNMYDTVHLDCDGFLVALQLGRVQSLRLGISVHVNGWFKGVWLGVGRDNPPTEEGRRFYQERTASVYRGKQKIAIRRAFGKKKSEAKFSYRYPFWASAKSLRRHLVTNNESIRLLSHDEYQAGIEALSAEEAEATA